MAKRTRDENGRFGVSTGGTESGDGTPGTAVDGSERLAAEEGSAVVEPVAIAGSGVGDGGNQDDSGGASGSGGSGRRRGRPRGARTKPKPKPEAEAAIKLGDLSELIYGTHAMLYSLTHVEEIELEKPEAAKVAGAIKDVAAHYPNAPKLSGKTVAWIMFLQTMVAVYGVRVAAFRARKFAERQERANRAAPVIVARPPAPAAGGNTAATPSTAPPIGAKFETVETPDGPVNVRLQ